MRIVKNIKYLLSFLAICCIFSIFLNASGYVFLFFISQQIIKKEIKQVLKLNLPDSSIEYLKIKIGDPTFRKFEENEFFYNNNLYDIIDIKTSNGFMYIRCINDKKEEQLYKNLDDLIANSFRTDGGRGYLLNKLFSLIYLYFEKHFNYDFFELNFKKIAILFVEKNFFPIYFPEIPTPPPEKY